MAGVEAAATRRQLRAAETIGPSLCFWTLEDAIQNRVDQISSGAVTNKQKRNWTLGNYHSTTDLSISGILTAVRYLPAPGAVHIS